MKAGRLARLTRSTGARFVALYLALSFVSALPVMAFIYRTTDRLVLDEFQAVVMDKAAVLTAEYAAGGIIPVAEAIARRIRSGAANHDVLLLIDPMGRVVRGNVAEWPPTLRGDTRWSEMLLFRRGHSQPERFGLTVRRLSSGHRLLVGRVFYERGRLREALALALAGALPLSALIGLLGSVVLLRFMNSRVRSIASVAAQVATGDLGHRIEGRGTNDPFDRLAASLNAMLERLERLVVELRIVTDGLAHDLRSPLTRMRASVDRALADPHSEGSHAAFDVVSHEMDVMLRLLNSIRTCFSHGAGSLNELPLHSRARVADGARMARATTARSALESRLSGWPPGSPMMLAFAVLKTGQRLSVSSTP